MKPGDQVLVAIPGDERDLTKEVWGWVVDKKCPAGQEWISIDQDSGIVLNRDPRWANNSVVKIEVSQIVRVIPATPDSPQLIVTIAQEDGGLLDIRRVDGKCGKIAIRIDQGAEGRSHWIDHTGLHRL